MHTINVILPQRTVQVQAASSETIGDVRQALTDLNYCAFNLEYDGNILDDATELSALQLGDESTFKYLEAEYTEKESRLHIARLYDYINAKDTTTFSALKGRIEHRKCLDSIQLSPKNPPSRSAQLRGILLYLDVVTLEGKQLHITSTTKGYQYKKIYHSLITLLCTIPSFAAAYSAERPSPILTAEVNTPAWRGTIEHSVDPMKIQKKALENGFEDSRDWNEELQSTRELPVHPLSERILRARLIQKTLQDFNATAARGAELLVRGELTALNPAEPHDARMYIYDNIFFSRGLDGVGTFARDGGDAAAHKAVALDVAGVKLLSTLDVEGLYTLGTCVVDFAGERIVAQSIVPGIFRQREDSQIIYGGVDGRDVIATDPAVGELFSKVGRALHLKRHTVLDAEKKEHELELSVETKGLAGADGRKYILDLYRLSPYDQPWEGYPHKMTIFRQELLDGDYNPDAYINVRNDEDEKDIDKLKDLLNQAIDKVIEDKVAPIDSHSLSNVLHRRGINIRYLGAIIKKSQDKALINVASRSILARSVKHCLMRRRVKYTDLPKTVSSFLRSLPNKEVDEEAKRRFNYVPEMGDWRPLLREICLQCGIKLKLDTDGFSADDIIDIVPIIKDGTPRSGLAEEALEAGRVSIAQGNKDLGNELLLESLSLYEQIYGVLHPESARCYTQLAMIYNSAESVELARKAVIVAERTLGEDHSETLLYYLNLSLFEHANTNTEDGLLYIQHAYELWKRIYGTDHPDMITTMNNIAVMLQSLKRYPDSLAWFERSEEVCSTIYGKGSLNAATLLFQISQALALTGRHKESMMKMRDAHEIFKREFGVDDENTKETKKWLSQLTQNAVNVERLRRTIVS